MTNWYSALRDSSARNRIQAVKDLVASDHPHAVELLRDVYRQETDPDVKQVMKRAGSYLQSTSSSNTQHKSSQPAQVSQDIPSSRPANRDPVSSEITWGQTWGRIFTFAGAMFALLWIVVFIAMQFSMLQPESLRQMDEIAIDPGRATLSLPLIVGLFFGAAFSVVFTPLWVLYHYFIHLFSTRVFKGENEFQSIIYYLFPRWILVFTAAFVFAVIALVFTGDPEALSQSIIFHFVIGPLISISIVLWMGQQVGKIYRIGFWRGLASFAVVTVLVNLVSNVLG